MNYSNKINFIDTKNDKLKSIIIIITVCILSITTILTIIYKDIVKPTTITFKDVKELLMDYNITEPIIYKKTKDIMLNQNFYANNINLIDVEYVNFNTINAPIYITFNYSTGIVECLATAEIQYKYKQGWFIKDFIDFKVDNFIPLFSAGSVLLDILSDAVYSGKGFSFNNVNYEYTKSYVDSLYVISEEGDISSTIVNVGSYYTDRDVHISATLFYNFNKNNWEILEYKPTVYS